jgi:hypothetical protein
MRFFLKGLNHFKSQTRFELDLLLNFIFKIQRDLEVDSKIKKIHLKLSAIMPSLKIFGLMFCICKVGAFELKWKNKE